MSYDGTPLNETTGIATARDPFSAASKESLRVMLYTHVLAGSQEAAQFLSLNDFSQAPSIAYEIMALKLQTYLKFNESFPGFGEFIPWYTGDEMEIVPTWDWELASGWQEWLDYTKRTAAKILYAGNGTVCAVTDLKNQTYYVIDPIQTSSCEGTGVLNDPYEGELFTWWLYFFGGISDGDRELLWGVKRPQLLSVEYQMGDVGPIMVPKGHRLHFHAGIPSISNQTIQELDGITPYSVFPKALFDNAVGMAWWKTMIDGKKMQNPYGSSESTRIDGAATSSFVWWDSKITAVNGVLGGVSNFVRQKMQDDGIYEDILAVTQFEYGLVFKDLKGEDVQLWLSNFKSA